MGGRGKLRLMIRPSRVVGSKFSRGHVANDTRTEDIVGTATKYRYVCLIAAR